MDSPTGRDPSSFLSRDAFAQEFQAAARGLWCIAAAIVRDRTLADDVLQEAAVIALGKRHEFQPGTSFQAWAGQVVRFTALNEARKRARAIATPTDPGILAESGPAAPAISASASFSPPLLAALDTLDETARTCLLMRTVMDMSYKQIAAALDIPEGTAMSHVHRSRQALRTRLAPAQMGDHAAGGRT